MTGLTVILVRESPHQDFSWSSRISRWRSSIRPVGPKTVCSPHRLCGVEVGVEDDLTRGGEVGSRYAGSFLTGYSTTGC